MKNYCTSYRHFLHGADYNPEQWIKYPEILKKDIEYMKKAHCNVMSIGIFSWALLEPEEGMYNFEFFDKIVNDLTENGIKIFLATPSGARPRWLAEKYPEVLRVDSNNNKHLYGERHNHCYTSPVYREKVSKINRLLAERYSNNKNVILWHISNEYGGECHCELCQEAFRQWLREKYENDLDKLNHAWWSGFWSHTVTDWDQIHSPVSVGEGNRIMPGLYIDWQEFVTYQTTDFMRVEIDAVKSVNPDIPVTTNFMSTHQLLDYHYMKDFVDVISWDCYPAWHDSRGDGVVAYIIAFLHDLQRSFKSKPFLMMESTPSLTNWMEYNKLKRPNMHRLSSLQAIAHGSDSVQYFQWRKGRGGSEKFHGAVIDHDGKAEGRVFEDVRNVGITLEKIDAIAGTNTIADVAVVYGNKNRWALDNAEGFHNSDKQYRITCMNHYKEFWKRGINVDVIGLHADLSKYKILVLPMLYSVTEEQIEKIENFVANGGTVIATYMTGYVNESDLCYLGGFPGGKLKKIFGLTAKEIDTLYPQDENAVLMNGSEYKVVDYCELIKPDTAEVLGTYKSDFYADMPAVLKNNYKKGTAYYIACRDTGELLNDLYERIIKENNVPAYVLPEGVSIHSREDEEHKYLFIENYNNECKTVQMPVAGIDMENGEALSGNIVLQGYEIKIIMLQ